MDILSAEPQERVEPLFKPFEHKGLRLKNRIVMAPMTRGFSPGGVATEEVAAYYRRRAEGGVGLIVSEGTGVDRPVSLNNPRFPRFHGEAGLAAWKRVIDEVHAGGGVMAPQLWHMGAVRARDPDYTPPGPYEGPSGLADRDVPLGQAMSDAEVEDAIRAFADAAAAAKALGFDAVELHGAHGYLIDQFFWDVTNRRGDRWGGPTLADRARFAADVLRAVRRAVGPDYPVIIRLSQWKLQDYRVKLAQSPAELAAWLEPLVDAGADIIHCSQRRFHQPEFEGSDLNFAGWAKKVTGKPTITVGSVGLNGEFMGPGQQASAEPTPLDDLVRRLDRGEFDLVAVGRALLQDPQWATKIREGRRDELKTYDSSASATLF